MHKRLCMGVWSWVLCLWSPEEGIKSSGAVVTGDRDSPEVRAGHDGNELSSSARAVSSLVGLSNCPSPSSQ